MHLPVMKRILLSLKQIAKEFLYILRCLINAIFNIVIVRPNQSIPEVP